MLHGVLSDGTDYEYDLNNESEILVGERLGEVDVSDSDGIKKGSFWVKAKVNSKCLASYGKGFNVWNTMV